MKVSIIIPAYNEEKTLPVILKKVLSQVIPYEKEVIVVDDGSTDHTRELADKYKNIKLITNRHNLGKGASVRRALKIATGDLILIQDADLEYSPSDYPKLLKPFGALNVKVVYGSRVLGINPISHWTFNLGGRLVTLITNILYGTKITDEPTGYKVFRKEILNKFHLKSKRFEFCPELTAKIAKAQISIVEVPIKYNPRPISQKKIKWHDGIAAIFYLAKYRFFD
ncbi:MAG: glycosyltransferase family 2 protein [Patescibacteria group bacterium]